MIFTGSRNAAASDNSMYCMIPDPFPSSAFGKGSATPDYIESTTVLSDNMMKNSKNFRFLSGCTNGLPALSWPQKCETKLEI